MGQDKYLVFGAGLLTGLSSGRCNISAKSPETGYLGDSNFGGDYGAALVGAGFSHLVISGQSPKPVFLWVHDGLVEIREAAYLKGQDTLNTQKMIRENLVRWASVNTGSKNMAGRTGMGAVMGSKKL